MRLTTVILLASLIQVSAATFGQGITLNKENASLFSVLKDIRKQSGYDFYYDAKTISQDQKVSVSLSNATIQDALSKTLSGLDLAYEIEGKTVSIKKKEAPSFLDKIVKNFTAIDVRGRVVDEKDLPLAGATIAIKGKKQSVKTVADGTFILHSVEEDAILVITFVGFKAKEIKAAKDIGTIKMELEAQLLSEVGVTVNTGYQRIKPEQSTGSIAAITKKDYDSRVNTDFLSGMANKLPGLMINNDVQFSSDLNNISSSKNLFNIRGISTISGNQDPLIVIDGYPTELKLNMINPNEIESVTILKDAAASTVYGVRASNGVIVIERKQAKIGKIRVDFRANTSITPKTDFTRFRWDKDMAAINVAYEREKHKTSLSPTSWDNIIKPRQQFLYSPVYYVMAQEEASIISPEEAALKYQELGSYNNAEEYSRLLLQNKLTQSYNVNLSGGSPVATYYISANYTGNRAEKINNNNRLFLLSARTNLSLSKRFKVELTTDYQEDRSNSAPVIDIGLLYPYEPLQDANGIPLPINKNNNIHFYNNPAFMNLGFLDGLEYPLVDVNEISNKVQTSSNRFTANFKYDITKAINFNFGGIYEYARIEDAYLASEKSSVARQYVNYYSLLNSSGKLVNSLPYGGFLNQKSGSKSSYTLRGQFNYEKVIGGDHSINGILGGEVRKVVDKQNSAGYFGYNDETLLQQPIDYKTLTTNFSNPLIYSGSIGYENLFNLTYVDNRYVSLYSNIVYSFRDTYSFTASARIDQSNLFGTDPQYRYKPLWSVGLGWNIHKEQFMQNLSWVNQLKLRMAYGFNGNVSKLSLPRVIAKPSFNFLTTNYVPSFLKASLANSSLRWEQTKNLNIGLDFGIFKGINGSVDVYNKTSIDLLSQAEINPSIGYSAYINSASINNRGLEFRLQADWISRPHFNWNTGFVVSRNISKALKVLQQNKNPKYINPGGYWEGEALGPIFAYRWAGLDSAGGPLLKNEKGDLLSPEASGAGNLLYDINAGYVRHMGSGIPAINAGLSNRVDIGNFYIYCMINYYGGFKTLVPAPNPSDKRPLAGAGNYWKQPGDEKNTNIGSLASYGTYDAGNVYPLLDRYVVNGDYLTLADLTVSYDFGNQPIFKRAGLSAFEVKLQASNLFTVGFNKYNYSKAMGSFEKSYITPTYSIALLTNF